MAIPLTYDGFNLSQYAYIRLERQPGPSMQASTQEVPGRAGAVFLGGSLEPLVVVAHCTLKREYEGAWDGLRDTLAAAFCSTAEKDLTLPDEGGRVRKAVSSFTSVVTEPVTSPVEFDITFTDYRVAATGTSKTVSVPSGSTVTFSVGGTLPPALQILATSAVRNASTGLWGLTFDNVYTVHVETGSASARRVEIDCDKRICKVAGALSMIKLDGVWPELGPGTHSVRIDQGTGTAVLTLHERWL